MGKFVDRTGQNYGRLTVLRRIEDGPASGGKRVKWLCLCECGVEKQITGHALSRGETTSCGCLRRELIGARRRTHGLSKTPTYGSWQAAKERCHNPNAEAFKYYGARGITMCDAWRNSFDQFLADMGRRPEGCTIDRIDQTKGYEPGNCQWATDAEQHLTRGTTRLYRWAGGWLTTREISEREGVAFNTLRKLVKQHRTIQAAVADAKARRRNFRAA